MEKKIVEMALDIMKVSSLPLEISGAIATDLVELGYLKQEQGEWIIQDKELGKVKAEAKCSKCGRDVVYQIIDNKWRFENYCPHCGAKMKGE